MVAWQRFNGKGKGKSKGKGKVKGKGKGKYKGNNPSLEERKKRLAELKSRTNCQACGARGHCAGDDICPKNAKNESTLQSPARAYLTIGGETSGFDLALTGDEMSFDATALVAHARLDASDIPLETPPKAPPGTRRPRKPPRVIPSPPPPTPSVSLQEQQVTSSDSLRGQSAMPRVPAQQIDSDDEETAFWAAESFVIDQEHDERIWPRWMKVATPLVTARVERYFDMFGFQSEYREGTRNKVFTGLGGNTVVRHYFENKPGFYLRMYKDAKTGLMLINVADFDLLNDQALTPQLLRASKPSYALGATIPPPTCLTGGTNASGEHVDFLRSLTSLPGNHTLRFTHVAIGLDVMDEYPGTDGLLRRYISERHCGRIRDFSLGDREDRQMLVKTLRRRLPEEVHQTNIVLIDCRAFRDPASSALRNNWGAHTTTLSKILNYHKFPGLLLDLVERVIRFADKDPKTRILIGFICSKARHRSVACSYLMQVIHTALNYTVNTRTTAIASSGRHLSNRDTCPDCSHLSIATVRLMESVRERLVASWNKAVASAVSTSQHPKQSDTHVYACNSCDSCCW